MPICQPCRMPHNAAVCEDTLAGEYVNLTWPHCGGLIWPHPGR